MTATVLVVLAFFAESFNTWGWIYDSPAQCEAEAGRATALVRSEPFRGELPLGVVHVCHTVKYGKTT